MTAVSVQGLERSFGTVRAVAGIDFEVERGEIFAILGPNGAGKTTTVEILEGYLEPDGGTVRVLGHNPSTAGAAYRDRIGIVLQSSGIERELTPFEALRHLCRLYSDPADPHHLLALVGVEHKAHERIKTLSGGQRRRLDLAGALAGRPELVFLDEPTTGFDPAARRDAWSIVRRLRDGGTTVILTTHYLDEAQALADRVAVMSQGVIVAIGDPDTLGGRHRASVRIRYRPVPGLSVADLASESSTRNGLVEIETDRPTEVLARLTGEAHRMGVELEALEVTRPSLEDVYLSLVEGGTP